MLATTKRKLADAWSYLIGEDKRRREAEESRHNCFRWSTLPPDIICLIVHHLDHSEGSDTFSVDGNKGVVRMTMTCKEWRAAVPKDGVLDWNGRIYTRREVDHEYMRFDPEDLNNEKNCSGPYKARQLLIPPKAWHAWTWR